MGEIKSEVKGRIKLFSLLGLVPDPDFDMLLRITLRQDTLILRPQITLGRATNGCISHKDLEKINRRTFVYANLSFRSLWQNPP